ncbi:MAG: hypothetical protein AAF497_10650, partial [Planctomycetota bacterium]
MKLRCWTALLMLLGWVAVSQAQLPQSGDVVFGLSNSDPALTLELVRGPASGTGAVVGDIWNDDAFIQTMAFDNTGGVQHNAQGNLLGGNFGASATGGSIFSFSTTDASVTAGQFLADTSGLDPLDPTVVSRIGSLSVAPDNSKVAVMGYDRGSVIVYDYTPGDTAGGGAALSNIRETDINILFTSDTQGTAWIDSNTVAAFSSDGFLYEVNATSMGNSIVGNLGTNGVGSPYTSLAYNSDVSPYLFASHSNFVDGESSSTVFILDPASGYAVVNEIDLSTSSQTLREIALGPDGDLFFSAFGGEIGVLQDVVTDPASIADNSSMIWYTSDTFSSFSGMDVAHGDVVMETDGDFDNDGDYDCDDVNSLVGEIVSGANNPDFDLDGDGSVTDTDLDAWLVEGGNANIGAPFLDGDANLDGVVDVTDFNIWNAN